MRHWVDQEVRVALDRSTKEPDFRLIPVLGRGSNPEDLPLFLKQYQWLDLREGWSDAGQLKALVAGAACGRVEPVSFLPPGKPPFRGLQVFDVEDFLLPSNGINCSARPAFNVWQRQHETSMVSGYPISHPVHASCTLMDRRGFRMITGIVHTALIVRDYDEAMSFYCGKLGFIVVEDTQLTNKRWIRLRALGGKGSEILLSKAVDDKQRASVGNQTGGRVLFFLHTDDFDSDYARFRSSGIEFTEGPWEADYGKVAVFKDLYGNRIDLIEPRAR